MPEACKNWELPNFADASANPPMSDNINRYFDQVASIRKLWANSFVSMAGIWSQLSPGSLVFNEMRKMQGGALRMLAETWDQNMQTLNDTLGLRRTAGDGIKTQGRSLHTYKVGTLEARSAGAVDMHKIKGQVAVITGAASGIGHALALDMARRGAAGLALVDFSDRIAQVAREVNTEAGHQVAIAYRGDTTDTAFREEVYTDLTSKAGVPRICVPAAAITKSAASSSRFRAWFSARNRGKRVRGSLSASCAVPLLSRPRDRIP